jgi:hypothetical protein
VAGGLFTGGIECQVLFLRKQLAFYREHQVPPRRLTDAARVSLALWSQLFNWRAALVIVKPETLIALSLGCGSLLKEDSRISG